MVELPERAVKLRYSFNDIFQEYTRNCKTYSEAYEKTEAEHERYYGKRMYSGYDSFKNRKRKK